MATYAEWNKHFDKQSEVKLKTLQKAIGTLLGDPMIKKEYGYDLDSLHILMNASIKARK
jgi:hypothetical protein